MDYDCSFKVGDVIRCKERAALLMVVRPTVDRDGDITCYQFDKDRGLDVEDYIYIAEQDYDDCIIYRMETFETIKSVILEDVRW
jgi:hypothetical protein